ncbi:MAG: hypothetical protein AB4040_03100 [Synechococcus sp.]
MAPAILSTLAIAPLPIARVPFSELVRLSGFPTTQLNNVLHPTGY